MKEEILPYKKSGEPDTGVGIAVIGSGYWGKNLVRNYSAMGSLRLICDNNQDTLSSFKQQYPEADVCLALTDALNRADVHGIVIATPAETHYSLAKEALLADKHVYVEKPLVLDESHARELIDLARERGRVLMVGHLLQYHPVFEKLKEMARAGEFGRINYIYSHRLNLGKIRREENILWSFAPHDISMILTLAGEQPESITATGGNYLHKQITDVTTTHLDFPSGLKAHIFVSWLHPFKEQKLVVVGDRKMAVFDDTLPWEDKLLLYGHDIRWENGAPVPAKAEPERVRVPEAEPLRKECEHFIGCIKSGKFPLTDGEEGLRVLKVLNASQRALNQYGCAVFFDKIDGGKPGVHPEAMVHESAAVDQGVEIGKGCKVWHFSHILSGSKLAENVNVGQNVVIGPDSIVGSGCKIQNNVSIYKGVTLEEDVFCGPSMVFTNVFNPRAHIRRMDEVRPTLIKRGATIGANATLVCGNTIGRYAFVGAGAVVTRDVPDHGLVLGNPAKRTGWVCECGVKLDDSLECEACGIQYEEGATGLKKKA